MNIYSLFFLVLIHVSTSDADSFDYHLGFAVSVENNSILPRNDWSHYRLFGYGEYLNLFSLYFFKNFSQALNLFFIINMFNFERFMKSKTELNLVLLIKYAPFNLASLFFETSTFVISDDTFDIHPIFKRNSFKKHLCCKYYALFHNSL